jgi:hypothetical protein
MRVQIPAYTDRWMMGDRYGDVVKVTERKLDSKARIATGDRHRVRVEIAHVQLDKSGKTVRVILDDCTVV